ncbi:MAG: F0F1 ATP synthase subunit A [Burkholderiales bacterium]|nr:F0F1 ATP synthase subunit A [Phycisphaerae bacterium]
MIISLLASANPLDHVTDTGILKIGNFWVLSNHIVMLLTTAVIMLLIFPRITKPYRDGKLVPTGSRNMIEAIMLYIRNDVAKPVLGDDTDRFMPLLWTLFFFVLINNLLGLLPFDALQNLTFGRVFTHFEPIYGTATSNFFVTGALALIVFVVVQFNGIKSNGIGGWFHHFLGGAPWWLSPVMVPVEFLGMLIKPFALAVRLAANMTAGHLLLAVLGSFVFMAWSAMGAAGGLTVGVVSVVASTAIMMLELFVALLQAYLFAFLTALFISQMIVHHHDDEHHKEHEGDEMGEPHAVRERDAITHETALKPAH